MTHAGALTIECPTCKAAPGHTCRNMKTATTHGSRLNAFKKKAAQPAATAPQVK